MKKNSVFEQIKYRMLHMGIKNKILLFVSLLIVVSLILFIYVFSSVFQEKINKNNITYSKRIIDNIITNFEDYFDEISSIANETNYNYYLQNYLIGEIDNETGYSSLSSGKSIQNYEMSTQLFSNAINNRSDVSSIMIFGRKSLLLYKTIYSYMYVIDNFTDHWWYREAVENPNKSIITGPQKHDFLVGNTDKTISLSKVISHYEDGSFLGVILIDVNMNEIGKICENIHLENSGIICMVNDQGELVYEQTSRKLNCGSLNNTLYLEKINQNLEKTKANNFFIELNNEQYQVIYSKMDKTGWKVLSITPDSYLRKGVAKDMYQMITVFVFLFLLVFFALNFILKSVIRPIITLKEYMDVADGGNLKIRVAVESKDEVGRLAKSFNKMLERIENLKEQVVEEQENKRKFELQALQAQINPHFLYNTLDSIIWMAEIQDKNIVKMTEALAKLFRISLNKGNEMISINDELEHVRNYLVIQSMRYMDKFDYTITIDDEIRYCKTIKLIVQPIVENCIYHGIKKRKQKGHIGIAAYKESNKVLLVITDNGNGMNEKMCRNILSSEEIFENATGSGIAVKNVNERIKVRFGSHYGLEYKSTLGEGTTVIIRLPIIEEVIQ